MLTLFLKNPVFSSTVFSGNVNESMNFHIKEEGSICLSIETNRSEKFGLHFLWHSPPLQNEEI